MDIRCFECGKLFATYTGNLLITPSSSIDFEPDISQIEIKCPRCKKMTTVMLSTGFEMGLSFDGL